MSEYFTIFHNAIELLSPIRKGVHANQYVIYFEDKNGEVVENCPHCCDSEECIIQAKRQIWEGISKRIRLETFTTIDGGDHDKFNHCEFCDVHTNEHLSYVEDEVGHFLENLNEMPTAHEAYELSGIFNSMNWFCDGRGNEERRQLVWDNAVKLANMVINIIQTNPAK